MGHTKMDDQIAIQEAISAGMRKMERLIYLLSHQSQMQAQGPVDCREITDSTVSKFKNVISILNRTGHARFRWGPVMQVRSEILALPASAQAAATQSQTLTLDFSKTCPNHGSEISNNHFPKESFNISPRISSANLSFMSSITGDSSVSNGKQGSSLLLAAAPVLSARKPPLSSSSYKKKCHGHGHGHSEDLSGKYSLSGSCHCSKKRLFPQYHRSSPESSLSSYLEGESPPAAVNLWHCRSFRKS